MSDSGGKREKDLTVMRELLANGSMLWYNNGNNKINAPWGDGERRLKMEFNEKLQYLRKQKGITQEELATALFVSRTAVSKWESGRGYPGIDSLKAIASFYAVTVDELLSGEELITVAKEEQKQKAAGLRDLVFGLSDIGTVLLLILPLFRQSVGGAVEAVSLMGLSAPVLWLRIAYWSLTVLSVLFGIATLALQNYSGSVWIGWKRKCSLALSVFGVLLLVNSLQPYGATYLLLFLMIKLFLLLKKQ